MKEFMVVGGQRAMAMDPGRGLKGKLKAYESTIADVPLRVVDIVRRLRKDVNREHRHYQKRRRSASNACRTYE